MEERARRIVETAIELAEKGGYEAVRLRDVALKAGVALGTVYKRFRSKEEILIAALERHAGTFETMIKAYPIPGDSPTERVSQFFALATNHMCSNANFARAVLRAVASGEPDLAEKIARFHSMITGIINLTIAGPDDGTPGLDDRYGFLLQQIWFAAMVGWMSGLHGEPEVIEQMRFAIDLILP
ncbi:MAG: AcrR family transcriptional regulator [Myxococcota bacterium]|jgi:AcrR family transcriptional regulator